MDLYYHRSPKGNFGDDLNEWLWDDLLPGWRDWSSDRTLVGVGTLLSSDLERRLGEGRRFLVAGTGVGYGDGRAPDVSDPVKWDVRSVRGPGSARLLGLPESLGTIDPAAMIPRTAALRASCGRGVQSSFRTRARSSATTGQPFATRRA